MKAAILLLIPLLAGCGRGDGDGRDDASGAKAGKPVQTAELTGLYEARSESGQSARMCMVTQSGATSFAIVVETPGGASCAGAGTAVREADRLRLVMAGDSDCAIEAAIAGTRVTLPAAVGQGCAYYCGPGASLAGVAFEKIGGSAEDAARATDLAGDPLCG